MGYPTTPDEIIARAIAVIQGIVPELAADVGFTPFENRDEAAFVRWCQENPAAAFRKVQVRMTGDDKTPNVSSVDITEQIVTIEILVAYPQDSTFYDALGRDRVMDRDRYRIDRATGMHGRANFSASVDSSRPDACWIESDMRPFRREDKVDFVVLVHKLIYARQA